MGGDTDKDDKIRLQKHGDTTWLNVRNPNSETFKQLEKDYRLHPVHLSESVQKVQHNQVEREDNYLFIVLHFPIFELHTDKIYVGQVGVFLGKDYLITVHTETSPFIDDLFAVCQHSQEEADKAFN